MVGAGVAVCSSPAADGRAAEQLPGGSCRALGGDLWLWAARGQCVGSLVWVQLEALCWCDARENPAELGKLCFQN